MSESHLPNNRANQPDPDSWYNPLSPTTPSSASNTNGSITDALSAHAINPRFPDHMSVSTLTPSASASNYGASRTNSEAPSSRIAPVARTESMDQTFLRDESVDSNTDPGLALMRERQALRQNKQHVNPHQNKSHVPTTEQQSYQQQSMQSHSKIKPATAQLWTGPSKTESTSTPSSSLLNQNMSQGARQTWLRNASIDSVISPLSNPPPPAGLAPVAEDAEDTSRGLPASVGADLPSNTLAEAPPSSIRLPRIEITFCTQCKWLLRAAYYAQELLSTFERDLGEVALRPATGGNFSVHVIIQSPQQRASETTTAGDAKEGVNPHSASLGENNKTTTSDTVLTAERRCLWDRKVDGGFPETKVLKQRVRDCVAPGRGLGHVDRHASGNITSNAANGE